MRPCVRRLALQFYNICAISMALYGINVVCIYLACQLVFYVKVRALKTIHFLLLLSLLAVSDAYDLRYVAL